MAILAAYTVFERWVTRVCLRLTRHYHSCSLSLHTPLHRSLTHLQSIVTCTLVGGQDAAAPPSSRHPFNREQGHNPQKTTHMLPRPSVFIVCVRPDNNLSASTATLTWSWFVPPLNQHQTPRHVPLAILDAGANSRCRCCCSSCPELQAPSYLHPLLATPPHLPPAPRPLLKPQNHTRGLCRPPAPLCAQSCATHAGQPAPPHRPASTPARCRPVAALSQQQR